MVSLGRRIILSLALIVFPQWVEASGFSIYEYGAEEQAQGNAVAAQVNSPSAIFYNPAGMADLEGTQIKVGTSILFPRITFHSDTTGLDTKVDAGLVTPTYFFITKEVNNFGIGFGFFSANGNQVDYPKDWEGRFFLTSAKLLQLNFAPTIAYKVSENLLIGVNTVLTYAEIGQGNQIDLSPLGVPGEGSLGLKGDGFGAGATVGLKARLGSSILLGVVYKSPMTIRFDGNANFQTPAAVTPLFPDGGFHTTLKFPQMVIVGLANQSVHKLTIEADVQWTNWHTFSSQALAFDNKTIAVQDVSIPFNWRDTWTVRVGGHYDINDTVTIRLGYVFDPSAVPDSTISPLFPELNKHIVTAGLGICKGRWTADLYYGRIIAESRHVDNSLPGFPTQRGEYEASADAVGISIGYRF
jgi:long-chain fatty acid transport protein